MGINEGMQLSSSGHKNGKQPVHKYHQMQMSPFSKYYENGSQANYFPYSYKQDQLLEQL